MSFGLKLALVIVSGVATGVTSSAGWYLGLAVSIGAGALAVAIGSEHRRWCARCLFAMVWALALAHGAHARDQALWPSPAWLVDDSQPVLIEGRLQRDASVGESGVRLELRDIRRADGARGDEDARHLDVLAIVSGELAPASIQEWTAGRRVKMPARLRPPAVVRNPGAPDVRWQQLTRPFDLVGAVKSGALVEVRRATIWQETAASARRHVRLTVNKWLAPLDAQSGAIVTAILIGDRAGLDDAVTRRLQAAGTFHVVAISGGNIAILTALCLFILRLLVRGERGPVLITLIIVMAYGMMVGRDASVARAVVAAALYLGLRLAGLVPSAINVLAMTALVCAVGDPLMVLDVGAWLSFGATLGLISILPRLMTEGASPGGRRAWLALSRMTRGLVLATVAAEIMILPVAASMFMRVSVAGLLLNFAAIPAMTLAQVAGMALCAIAAWWPGAGAPLAMLAHLATASLTGSAALVDVLPWLSWRVPPPPLAWVAAYYAAVLVAMTWSGRRSITRAAIAAAAIGACGFATAPWTVWQRPRPGWMRVTIVDVGQGEAIAVQSPGGHVLLVDAGGSPGAFDVGGRVVTPALWASGIRRLDWLAITHGDVDHLGGALRVAEDLRPREVWEGVPVPQHQLMAGLRRAAPGAVWRRLQAGHQVEIDGVVIDVLHPPMPDWERRRVRNDDSLVLRLRFGLVEMLLTGDAGPEFESVFNRDESSPPIRLLKAGHHGSRTSSSERFLDLYAPAAALVSVGQSNLFGHPSPVVLERLRHRGIDVFRTDRDGAIVIETDGREARVRSATGRVLRVTVSPQESAAVRASPAATPPPSPPESRHARTTRAVQGPLQRPRTAP